MDKQSPPSDTANALLPVFAAIASGVAVVTWAEALDFDPCNTILTRGGADCIEAGLAGVILGALCILLGLAIARGAISPPDDAPVTMRGRVSLGWLGLMLCVTGAAIAFAQWTVGLGL